MEVEKIVEDEQQNLNEFESKPSEIENVIVKEEKKTETDKE